MHVRACLIRRLATPHVCELPRLRRQTYIKAFHSTTHRLDGFPDHYATLNVQPNASDKDIKKQFYALSKSYHPDLHPNDPNASERFVKISEAYAVLSSSDKRAIYDRDFQRASAPAKGPSTAYPSGSFSSASTPAGGRPASGLSRRRTQFKGPPPSFYQAGGWGEQSAKRAEYAARPSHGYEREGSVGAGQDAPGTGPGGFTHGFQNDVPHFDSQGHYQTHSTIERTRHKARRRVDTAEREGNGGGVLFGFIMISSVLSMAVFITSAVQGASQPIRPIEDK